MPLTHPEVFAGSTHADCGLTEELSRDNFLIPISDKHGLLLDGDMRVEELAAIDQMGLDANGARACSMFEVW